MSLHLREGLTFIVWYFLERKFMLHMCEPPKKYRLCYFDEKSALGHCTIYDMLGIYIGKRFLYVECKFFIRMQKQRAADIRQLFSDFWDYSFVISETTFTLSSEWPSSSVRRISKVKTSSGSPLPFVSFLTVNVPGFVIFSNFAPSLS